MRRFGVHAGLPARRRLLVVSMAVVAMVSPLGAVSSAQAAAKETVPLSAPATTAALAPQGLAAVAPASLAPAVRVPTILLKPSTAIGRETVKVTGKLSTVKSRPVLVQRRSGTRWVTVAKAKTSRTGSYATTFRAPASRLLFTIRTLAPRVRIAGTVRAQHVTSTRKLRVVAQTASLSMPATLMPLKLSTATLTFRPIRAGRTVALQMWRSGHWVSVVSGRQSAAGTASLPMRAGLTAKYAYRAQTAGAAGAAAFASPLRLLTVSPAADITAPKPVTGLRKDDSSNHSVALGWVNPLDADFSGVTIRRATGSDEPAHATAASWTLVAGLAAPANTYADNMLSDGTKYYYAIFSRDRSLNYGAPAFITIETQADPGAMSGTVTDDALNPLENVRVSATSDKGNGDTVMTGPDGTWSMSFLVPDAYTVCFNASSVISATGYAAECYNDVQIPGTPDLVTVVSKGHETGIDAKLSTGLMVSGTVTELSGAGLTGVEVMVYSPSTGDFGFTETADTGTYTVKGLAGGTDYEVCFNPDFVTGGSLLGYIEQCYANQSGTPTPVIVTAAGPTTGINAVLVTAGGIKGNVTDSVDALKNLEDVFVMVTSESTGDFGFATTGADGSYTVKGLVAGTDYTVCFEPADSTGGPGAFGYSSLCYLNQPDRSTSTPVSVSLGEATPLINAALVQGGAVSGKVTDAADPLKGVEGASVTVESNTTGDMGVAFTDADGNYLVKGLDAGTDYTVCFESDGDVAYVKQCYDNQSKDTPTLVTVTPGTPRTGVDAALVVQP